MHEMPPRTAVSEVPVSEHVPAVTDQDSDPDVWPPAAVSDSVEPVTNEAALVTENPVCGALFTVTEVLELLTAL